MCHHVHIMTLLFHAGWSWGSWFEKVSFHFLPMMIFSQGCLFSSHFCTSFLLPCPSYPLHSSCLLLSLCLLRRRPFWRLMGVTCGMCHWGLCQGGCQIWRMSLLTWVWEINACLHIRSHCWMHLSTAKELIYLVWFGHESFSCFFRPWQRVVSSWWCKCSCHQKRCLVQP